MFFYFILFIIVRVGITVTIGTHTYLVVHVIFNYLYPHFFISSSNKGGEVEHCRGNDGQATRGTVGLKEFFFF